VSDELGNPASWPGAAVPTLDFDSRRLPELPSGSGSTNRDDPTARDYSQLQRTRAQVDYAIALLKLYAPDSSALAAHLYAVEGYSEIFLAEVYCSGIPLSTIDFDADYTFKPGSSTDEVLLNAVALFDSALSLAGDSVRFVHLANMGRARSLLNLGRFADAAAAAAEVPDGYQYAVSFNSVVANAAFNFARLFDWSAAFTVSDREGMNGMDFRTSSDPRTRVTARGTHPTSGQTIWHPNKYNVNGATPIVLADWIEARLIESEAALQTGDITNWLGNLNHLRQLAITPALADLSDPGTPETRVDLLFRERAFWLFLTGHRQGDLRRLIRQYGRTQESVYPSGSYSGAFSYGFDVTVPVPLREREINLMYGGCLDRGA
jgi:hypothetical protein